MKQNNESVLVLIFVFFISGLYAQEKQISSLLSNYGLGSSFDETTVFEKGQGGVSVVGNNNQEVTSIANPSLLSSLKLTTFSVAFQSLGAKIKTPNSAFESSAISISNISLGVPLGNKGGFQLGVRAHSAVGYETSGEELYNNASGGVNQAYIGLGYQIIKGLSLGLQYNKYFGKIEKRKVVRVLKGPSVQDDSYNVNGSSFKIGLQYKHLISEKIELQLGAYTVLDYNINATGESKFYLATETEKNVFEQKSTSELQTNDLTGNEKNAIRSVYGIGLGHYNHWFAGISYEHKNALEYSGNVFEETLQKNGLMGKDILSVAYEASSNLRLGTYFIPKKYALKNYLKRIIYRTGFTYEKTGLVLNDNSVKNLGMSFGLGLPVGKRVSYLNFSLEVGKIGDVSKNNYEEQYINMGVNISLSDKWFKKRVID